LGCAAADAANSRYKRRSVADHTKRIAEIRETLRSGATEVSTDGTTVIFSEKQLRKELRLLMAEDRLERDRRPVAASIKLG
jgi:hypothetical protein